MNGARRFPQRDAVFRRVGKRVTITAMRRLLPILALAALGAARAVAQGGSAGTLPAQPQTRMADKAAVAFIASDSVGDVQLANLALQKSQFAAVRSFAQTMVGDHTKSALQAMDVAKRIGASNAKLEPSDEILIAEQHLARYKGYEFEEEWLKQEIAAHQTDIDTVRDALEVASDAGVMQLELSTLQTDEKHLGLANAAFDELERTKGRAK
jgi:putative membrane protein